MPAKPKQAKKSIRGSATKNQAASKQSAPRDKVQSWEDIPRTKWNPWFVKLYEYSKAKSGAWEDHPWGEIVFKFGSPGKVFVFLGVPDTARACVKATEEDFDEWLSLPFVKIAPYIGRFGWVVIAVQNARSLKVALQAIDKSYDQIAGRK